MTDQPRGGVKPFTSFRRSTPSSSTEKKGYPMGKEDLIGTWHLVSSEFRHADGEVTYPLGKNGVGLLIYTADGHMTVQLMRTDRPAFASGDAFQGTPEEIKAAYEGCTAYFGTYTVDDVARTVTHHVQGHTFPNYSGSKVTREFTLVDQCLTLRASIRRDGRPLTALLIWARAMCH